MGPEAETFVEQSLWPDLVPERELRHRPDFVTGTHAILASLAMIGITYDRENYVPYYGRVTASLSGVFHSAYGEEHCDTTTQRPDYEYTERWICTDSYDGTANIAIGHIESLRIVEIDGRKHAALLITPNITDMGIEDSLILVESILEIATLSPEASQVIEIIENNMAGINPSYYAELDEVTTEKWNDFLFDYLDSDPEYKVIWRSGQEPTGWQL